MIKIFHAENGNYLEIPLSSFDSVGSLKMLLQSETDILPNNQILLRNHGIKIEDDESIQNLNTDKIFLYNRNSFSVDLTQLQLTLQKKKGPSSYFSFQPVASSFHLIYSQTKSLSTNLHIEVSTTSSFDDGKGNNKQQEGKVQLSELEPYVNFCKNVLNDCKNQLKDIRILREEGQGQLESIDVAFSNLKGQLQLFCLNYNNFKDKVQKFSTQYQDLLLTFDSDLEYLKQKEIHPFLQDENKKTLYDCVAVVEMKAWKTKCSEDFQKFQQKIETEFQKAPTQVDDLTISSSSNSCLSSSSTPGRGSPFHPSSTQTQTQTQTQQQQQLESTSPPTLKIFNPTNTIPTFITSSTSVSLQNQPEYFQIALDLVRKVEGIFEDFHRDFQLSKDSLLKTGHEVLDSQEILSIHLDDLKSIVAIHDDSLHHLHQLALDEKQRTTQILFEQLHHIAKKQNEISRFGKKLMTYTSILNTLNGNFSVLAVARYLPGAYSMALQETLRRNTFIQQYNATLEKFIGRMKKHYEGENETRRLFLKHMGRFLPNGLIPHLGEMLDRFSLDSSVKKLVNRVPVLVSEKIQLEKDQDVKSMLKMSVLEADLKEFFLGDNNNNNNNLDQEEKLQIELEIEKREKERIEREKQLEINKMKEVLLEKEKMIEKLNEKLAEQEKIIEEERKRTRNVEHQLQQQMDIYKTTINELVTSMNELDSMTCENMELKKKLNSVQQQQQQQQQQPTLIEPSSSSSSLITTKTFSPLASSQQLQSQQTQPQKTTTGLLSSTFASSPKYQQQSQEEGSQKKMSRQSQPKWKK